MTAQRRNDQIQLIGQYLCCNPTHSSGLQQLADSRPGEVDLLSPPTAVADRQHNSANIGRKTLSHAPSLRVSSMISETSPQSFLPRIKHQK
jgi:hypothetical protein